MNQICTSCLGLGVESNKVEAKDDDGNLVEFAYPAPPFCSPCGTCNGSGLEEAENEADESSRGWPEMVPGANFYRKA